MEGTFQLSNDYQFIQSIATLKNGEVFKAQQRDTGRMVAVKIVRSSNFRHFRRSDPIEVRTMSKLIGLPNFQQFVAFYRQPNVNIIVSDMCAQDSCHKCVAGKQDKIKKFMFQLLTAIQNLHQRGIIHRDIKQNNIMWDDSTSTLTLIDFDGSTFLHGYKHTSEVYTRGFRPPEMTDGKSYTSTIDIWSAGVVFGCLVCSVSEKYVEDDIVASWIQNLDKEDHKRSPTMDFLKKMLTVDPTARPSASDLLMHPYLSNV